MGLLSSAKGLLRRSDKQGLVHIDVWTARFDEVIPFLGLDAETEELVRSDTLRRRRAGVRRLKLVLWTAGPTAIAAYGGLIATVLFRSPRFLVLLAAVPIWVAMASLATRLRPEPSLAGGIGWLAIELGDAGDRWRDASGRWELVRHLDRLARVTERLSPAAYGVKDPEAALLMRQRFRALAARFRAMECEAALPAPDTRESLLAKTGEMLAHVARGDWARLLDEAAEDAHVVSRRSTILEMSRRLGAVLITGSIAAAGVHLAVHGEALAVRTVAGFVASVGLIKLLRHVGVDSTELEQARGLLPRA